MSEALSPRSAANEQEADPKQARRTVERLWRGIENVGGSRKRGVDAGTVGRYRIGGNQRHVDGLQDEAERQNE